MSTRDERGFAIAAVDGTEASYAAVRFAVEEASRLDVGLRLAHVTPVLAPAVPVWSPETARSIRAFASETLASAARIAQDVAPEVGVSTHLLSGGRVSQIVELADGAAFVVVGRRPSALLDRAWSGGTLDGVVSRSQCPVYVVPEDLRRERDGTPRVVAGFKSTAHADELFEAAFGAAAGLGAELEVLHAWKLSSGYDDMIATRVSEAAWNHEQKDAIWTVLRPWLDAYPHVHVRVRVTHEHPVRALVGASRDADRLVLVKPLHGGLAHHLGRTARGVLRFAGCPVEMVPSRRRSELTMPPIEVERAGDLVP